MRITFLVHPGFQSLDLTGPLEVFALAGGTYATEVVAAERAPVESSSGLAVLPHRAFHDDPVDTLIVVGGPGTAEAVRDERTIAWITTTARRARRVGSVCSGAFLLARAGLLDGRRATTHWSACRLLEERFPSVEVDPDPIFVRDDPVWTSAGVTAGIDLALAMVEDDLGAAAARTVARQLVVFVQRPGGQAQFSAQLAAQRPDRPGLRELQRWIADHLTADLSVEALAARTGLSTRHFARVFRDDVGVTPGAYVESVRVEAARRLLETSARPLDVIARECGFGTPETMHRSFRRTVSVTPGDYRRRFRGHASVASR
ncbi:GlxA family transcriptional regulator [Actinoallomurus spadix]|uniref:GlxA family transcriptional regulator n=1 Tax=Actinoallomurus spadix TaxID=79912 RepID=A0ABP3G4T1_9ACTN|nr:GlxA family transcriptional regulator [Actinoallomurus spadix]MCO5987124.1 GlxA family transcriptional regulator [Actinoallomurus spadix]